MNNGLNKVIMVCAVWKLDNFLRTDAGAPFVHTASQFACKFSVDSTVVLRYFYCNSVRNY